MMTVGSLDGLFEALQDPAVGSQGGLMALAQRPPDQEIEEEEDVATVFNTLRVLSERAELDSNDVELLKAIFDKLTASYTEETVAKVVGAGGPESLKRLFRLVRDTRCLQQDPDGANASLSVRNSILRTVQDIAIVKESASKKRPGQEAFAPIWIPFTMDVIERETSPLHLRECTRVLMDLVCRNEESMRTLLQLRRQMRTLLDVTLPSMGDFNAQENVLELLVNLARKKLFALDGPHMKGFPPAAIDKMRQASETKISSDGLSRAVREAVMAYNASLGKDASVLTFAVSAVRINGHPSALDPPFVDFGRTAFTFFGTWDTEDGDPDLQEHCYEHLASAKVDVDAGVLHMVTTCQVQIAVETTPETAKEMAVALPRISRLKDLLAESLGNERQPRMPKMSIGMVARSQQQPQAGQDARQTQVPGMAAADRSHADDGDLSPDETQDGFPPARVPRSDAAAQDGKGQKGRGGTKAPSAAPAGAGPSRAVHADHDDAGHDSEADVDMDGGTDAGPETDDDVDDVGRTHGGNGGIGAGGGAGEGRAGVLRGRPAKGPVLGANVQARQRRGKQSRLQALAPKDPPKASDKAPSKASQRAPTAAKGHKAGASPTKATRAQPAPSKPAPAKAAEVSMGHEDDPYYADGDDAYALETTQPSQDAVPATVPVRSQRAAAKKAAEKIKEAASPASQKGTSPKTPAAIEGAGHAGKGGAAAVGRAPGGKGRGGGAKGVRSPRGAKAGAGAGAVAVTPVAEGGRHRSAFHGALFPGDGVRGGAPEVPGRGPEVPVFESARKAAKRQEAAAKSARPEVPHPKGRTAAADGLGDYGGAADQFLADVAEERARSTFGKAQHVAGRGAAEEGRPKRLAALGGEGLGASAAGLGRPAASPLEGRGVTDKTPATLGKRKTPATEQLTGPVAEGEPRKKRATHALLRDEGGAGERRAEGGGGTVEVSGRMPWAASLTTRRVGWQWQRTPMLPRVPGLAWTRDDRRCLLRWPRPWAATRPRRCWGRARGSSRTSISAPHLMLWGDSTWTSPSTPCAPLPRAPHPCHMHARPPRQPRPPASARQVVVAVASAVGVRCPPAAVVKRRSRACRRFWQRWGHWGTTWTTRGPGACRRPWRRWCGRGSRRHARRGCTSWTKWSLPWRRVSVGCAQRSPLLRRRTPVASPAKQGHCRRHSQHAPRPWMTSSRHSSHGCSSCGTTTSLRTRMACRASRGRRRHCRPGGRRRTSARWTISVDLWRRWWVQRRGDWRRRRGGGRLRKHWWG